MKDHGVRLRELARNRICLGDHAADRGSQHFGFAADLIELCLSFLEALEFRSRVLELRSRDCVAFDQLLEARDAAFDDRDLLEQLSFLLAHVGDVDGLDRRLDQCENLPLLDTAAERGEAAFRRQQPSGQARLHITACIRIGDDAARQFDRSRMFALLDDCGADHQQALH